ncbi:MAG: DUF4157 domain-containing protein [Bryobacteraceae bacterium]|nr:DUF4157 domain-containing protein [Bryobacteraceae bacterium]
MKLRVAAEPVKAAPAPARRARRTTRAPAPQPAPSLLGNAEFAAALAPQSDSAAEEPLAEPSAPASWLREEDKPAFLETLQQAVEREASGSLEGTGFTVANCPYIRYWFAYYAARPVDHIERAAARFAPETEGLSTPEAMVPALAARVGDAVRRWAVSGDLSGMPGAMPKPSSELDPALLQLRLGAGRPLPAAVRARLESAFRLPFPDVRVHTGPAAAELAARFQARAFTVGSHIAFAPNAYEPSTPAGEALLAHELAHVEQQRAATTSAAAATPAAEADANTFTAGVLQRLWMGLKAPLAAPRLRTGLALQRCASTPAPAAPRAADAACTTPLTGAAWTQAVDAANAHSDENAKRDALANLVRNAVCPLGITVHTATQTHADEVHPDDYQQAPVLNFDIHLHQKRRWQSQRVVGEQPGYFFSRGERGWSILGPLAISNDTPLHTRMYAQHELYHSTHHRGSDAQGSAADQELETWTNDFVNYFHQFYAERVYPAFGPLAQYYNNASPEARRRAIDRLAGHFRNPPPDVGDADEFRRQFRLWLVRSETRRVELTRQLVTDLRAAIGDDEPR